MFGTTVVSFTGWRLQISTGTGPHGSGELEHFHYDTFRSRLGDGRNGYSYVTFGIDTRGRAMTLRLNDSPAMEFRRRP